MLFFMQTRPKMWGPRKLRLGPPRFLGRSAKAMPLSVRTVWILCGKTSTILLRKAEPHLARAIVELDVGELGNPVDGEEHDELAVGVAQLAAIDVNVADLVGLEPLALLSGLLDRQQGDAVALQASVQGAATEVRDRVSQATQDIRPVAAASSAGTPPRSPPRPASAPCSSVSSHPMNASAFWFACAICAPSSRSGRSGRQGPGVLSFDAWNSARRRGVVRALP
jgi:hypothetical protein